MILRLQGRRRFVMSKSKILCVSYDESLLRTRDMILRKAGYDVTAALGFVEAQRLCAEQKFDVVVIGHTIPANDKLALIQCAQQGAGAAALCLRKPNDPVLREPDYSTDRTDPDGLVEAVKTTLAQRAEGGRS
jgi:hypothetical protein